MSADSTLAYINLALANTFTSLPAIITSTDNLTSENVVSVQPCIDRRLSNTSYSRPVIPDVPIQWPAGGGGLLTFPLQVGDTVLLTFSMQSTADWWISQTDTVTPVDNRMHDISDAFVIPQVFRLKDNPSPSPSHTELKFKDGLVRITDEGNLQFETKGTVSFKNSQHELIAKLTETLQTISDTTVNTTYGTSPLNNKAAIDALIVELETFKE